MSIAPPITLVTPGSQPIASSAHGSRGNLPQAGGATKANVGSELAATEAPVSSDSAHVTLSAANASHLVDSAMAPPYAEVWKDGMKIAVIDTHGGVNSVSGIVPSEQGALGAGGALLAARRATEIANSVGGEIRVGGMVTDSRTLHMTSKLKAMYSLNA